jgi:hypothetical protein
MRSYWSYRILLWLLGVREAVRNSPIDMGIHWRVHRWMDAMLHGSVSIVSPSRWCRTSLLLRYRRLRRSSSWSRRWGARGK